MAERKTPAGATSQVKSREAWLGTTGLKSSDSSVKGMHNVHIIAVGIFSQASSEKAWRKSCMWRSVGLNRWRKTGLIIMIMIIIKKILLLLLSFPQIIMFSFSFVLKEKGMRIVRWRKWRVDSHLAQNNYYYLPHCWRQWMTEAEKFTSVRVTCPNTQGGFCKRVSFWRQKECRSLERLTSPYLEARVAEFPRQV